MLETLHQLAFVCHDITFTCSPFGLAFFMYNQWQTFKINKKIDTKTDYMIKKYGQILHADTRTD